MKTMLDQATRDEVISRISTLDNTSRALWGKMDVYQMAKHCSGWEEMILTNKPFKQPFIGKLIGPFVLKMVLKDDSPLRRNSPTAPSLKFTDHGDVTPVKEHWIALVKQYADYSTPQFLHPFFGKMSREQVAQLAYKHADHHLRQFNA